MMKYFFVLITAFLFHVAGFSQTPQNLASWVGAELYLPFKDGGRWGLLVEGYLKGNKFLSQLQGSFYRVGANYYLKNGNKFGAGYAYQWNIPYDEVSLPYANPDYRIYEQFIWRMAWRSGDHVLSQRFRLEQRWLGRKNGPDYTVEKFDYYNFENTSRYQVRFQNWFKEKWAWVIYDEVHLRTTAPLDAENFLDQNRAYVGGVYSLDKKREIRMELGYMHQAYFRSADTESGKSRINHVIRITLSADLPMKHDAS